MISPESRVIVRILLILALGEIKWWKKFGVIAPDIDSFTFSYSSPFQIDLAGYRALNLLMRERRVFFLSIIKGFSTLDILKLEDFIESIWEVSFKITKSMTIPMGKVTTNSMEPEIKIRILRMLKIRIVPMHQDDLMRFSIIIPEGFIAKEFGFNFKRCFDFD